MPPPLDPQTRPPLERYCDLVLQGGVVDGVIYPGVLMELARQYRFQSLAGTSVGAIAASLAAACEYCRRFGSDNGFNEVLRKVPDELAKEEGASGRTQLRTLFQVEPLLQRLFDTLVEVFSAPKGKFCHALWYGIWKNYVGVLLGFFLAGFSAALVAALTGASVACYVVFVHADHNSPVPDLQVLASIAVFRPYLIGFLFGVLMAIFGLVFTLRREFQWLSGQPGFGFCSGLSTDRKSDALIEWLHKGLQGAAGLVLDRPLTFQDLWSAPCGPQSSDGTPSPKSIDLRMMTTCVSHGRPYEMPLLDTSVRLFFDLTEWKHYFPPSVIAHLSKKSKHYTHERVDFLPPFQMSPHPEDIKSLLGKEPEDFRELPVAELPVLVAVRLSMNFPILFQAVPLWAIDHEGGRTSIVNKVAAPRFRKVWFADGGITSNFPLHIFDSPVPAWPTFGVYIEDESRNQVTKGQLNVREEVDRPKYRLTKFHTSGRSERWQDISDQNTGTQDSPVRTKGFINYIFALAYSAKDWADKANLRMPGIRDRVVTVYKNGLTNGGLNLNLPGFEISNLAYDHGTQAGKALARKFLSTEPPFNPNLEGSPAWLDHRWVRFNAYLSAMKTHLRGLRLASHQAYGTSSLQVQIEQAQDHPPLYFEKCFEPMLTGLQGKALSEALAALEKLEAALSADAVVQAYTARPQSELKARSRT